MLKISYFHTNTHTETFAPLIACVIDDADGEKSSSWSTRFMTSVTWSSVSLMSGMVLSKVSSMCKSMKFWAFTLTPCNAYFILPSTDVFTYYFGHLESWLWRCNYYISFSFSVFGGQFYVEHNIRTIIDTETRSLLFG